MNRALSFLILLLFVLSAIAPAEAGVPDESEAGSASISGFVRDASTGETLLMANVLVRGTTIGAATNNAGYYTITGLDAGTYRLMVSYVGYSPFEAEVTLAEDEHHRLDIELEPAAVSGEEVVVTADRSEKERRNIGIAQLKTQAIKQLPAVLEPDVFRSLQLLPGVKAASDYSSGLYIRGGSPDQTLILLDRNAVYNPTHFFGFFSTFNPDAIKDIRLFKGGYPAEYGGRLGSVLDIYNKEGNRKSLDGTLSVGLLASRGMIEGPFKNGSFMFAARRSTLDPMLKAANDADVEGIPETFYFYDLNGKINFDPSDNNRLSLAAYSGNDNLNLPFLTDSRFLISVGNRTFSGNWTHLFSQKLFSNFTVASSHYFSKPAFTFSGTDFTRHNTVDDVSAKGTFEYIPNQQHSLQLGFWAGNFVMRIEDTFDGRTSMDERLQTLYASTYVQDTWRPNALWQLTGGIRANWFQNGDYMRLEPRFNMEYRPFADVRLQAGYGRYYQFLTLITSEVFSAFDMWLTTDEGVRPAYGDQFVAGVKTALAGDIFLDVEGYYRTMHDLFLLDPYVVDAAGLEYRDLFGFGEGYAQGVEVQLEKTRGRVNGFVGYTLGHTRRNFPNLAEGWRVPKYDRLHDLKAVVNYRLGRGWRWSGVFSYATGQAYSEPRGQFRSEHSPISSDPPTLFDAEYNNARLPGYHRFDTGFSKSGRFFGFADYELQLQVINAYARRNTWFYFYERQDDDSLKRNDVPQIPIPIPNLSLTLNF